jgi:excisionase family DNA binding protein
MPDRSPQGPLLTIREASQATGLSIKAVRGRVERGSLAAVNVGGRRRIPLAELLRAGLLQTEPPSDSPPRGTSSGHPAKEEGPLLAVVLQRLTELSDHLEQILYSLDRIETRLRADGGQTP